MDFKAFRKEIGVEDGRRMTLDVGLTFEATYGLNGTPMKYICFTDGRSTGPFLAKRKYIYFVKTVVGSGKIIYSDHADEEEMQFVRETLAELFNCSTKGPLCLFELVRGGVKSAAILE